jgi:uncharacterized membrane protein
MKNYSKTQYGLAFLVCFVLVVVAFYYLGYLVGYLANVNELTMHTELIVSIVAVASGVIAIGFSVWLLRKLNVQFQSTGKEK